MRIPVAQFLILIAALGYVTTQESIAPRPMVLDSHQSGVYLTYERQAARKPKYKTESDHGIWLRLHNNMRTTIYVYGNTDARNTTENTNQVSKLMNGAEIEACYDVESIPQLIEKNDNGNIELASPYRVNPIEDSPRESCYWGLFNNSRDAVLMAVAPGNSVTFSVPENFVTNGRRAATEFSCEWDADEHGYVREDQPHHRVYFSKPIR
jgi:hypothetical protein